RPPSGSWRAVAGPRRLWTRSSPSDVRRVKAFLAGADLELDFLSLGKSLESVHLDRREVNEHVFAAFLLNEAVPLGVIEPLHLPFGHRAASCWVNRSCPLSGADAPND